jgi:hypothetical protein
MIRRCQLPGKSKDKSPVENFSEMVKEFGETISKIFNDPELKKKSKEFAKSAEDSAKAFAKRFKDEGVKEKFSDFKRAARGFGKSMSDYFKSDKEAEEEAEAESDLEKKIDQKAAKFEEKVGEAGKRFEKKIDEVGGKIDGYFKGTRSGRITGYSFAIMWNVIFFVLFNFYSQYIAYYQYDGGTWSRYPILTESFTQWLPIVSTALVAAIIGNILMIIYDGYHFRLIVRVVLNLFSLTAVISLLTIFPFDFTVFPGDLTGILNPVMIMVLVLAIIGLIVDTIVKSVKLISSIGRSF